jgi:hypothetical protein
MHNKHHDTEIKIIILGSKSKSKRKSKLGFPVEYFSNITLPIIKISRNLESFICVLLVNFGFKICVDAIFITDDKLCICYS